LRAAADNAESRSLTGHWQGEAVIASGNPLHSVANIELSLAPDGTSDFALTSLIVGLASFEKHGRWNESGAFLTVTDAASGGFQQLRIEERGEDAMTIWIQPGSTVALRATLSRTSDEGVMLATAAVSATPAATSFPDRDALIGNWFGRPSTPTPGGPVQPIEIRLNLDAGGQGYFSWSVNGQRQAYAIGPWEFNGGNLIVHGQNGGYVTFRVLDLSPDQLRIANQAGNPATLDRVSNSLEPVAPTSAPSSQDGLAIGVLSGSAVTKVAFAAGADQVVAAGPNQVARVDITRRPSVRRRNVGGTTFGPFSEFSPDGRYVAVDRPAHNGAFETVLLEVDSGRLAHRFGDTLHTDSLGTLAVSSDGRRLLRVSNDTTSRTMSIRWWDLTTGRLEASAEFPEMDNPSGFVAISPRGDRYAVGTHRRSRANPYPYGPIGRILILDAFTNQIVNTIETEDIPRAMAFSPDGSQLFWGTDEDSFVHFLAETWDGFETGSFGPESHINPNANLSRGGGMGTVSLMAMVSDGSRLATASRRESLVRVWDPDTGALLRTIQLPALPTSLATDAEGRQFAAGLANGQVFVGNLDAGSSEATAIMATLP